MSVINDMSKMLKNANFIVNHTQKNVELSSFFEACQCLKKWEGLHNFDCQSNCIFTPHKQQDEPTIQKNDNYLDFQSHGHC